MECRVEFDYMAQEPDELTIKKGEIIKNVVTKMDGWFEGTLRGKTGVFPDNFVKVLEKPAEIPEPTPKPAEVVLRNNPSSARRVKVLFSYAPEQEDELTLDVGDELDFIEEVEEGWWRGRLKGKEGIFPSNFVQEVEEGKTNGSLGNGKADDVMPNMPKDMSRSNHTKGIGIPDVVPSPPANSITDEPAPELPPKPVRELARCFYPYKGQNEDELSLAEGDIITIISRQCEDEGWWRGELRGKIGMFPDNFVKIITPGEVQPTGNSNGPQPKLLAQERNAAHVADLPSKAKKDSIPNIGGGTVVDGGGSSKPAMEKDKSAESKIAETKAKLNKSNSRDSVVPKVGHVATSPIAPGIAAFHTNLFSNTKPDTFLRREPSREGSKDDKNSDESEDFNSVERTETLSHLTTTRAKAPKRRPPSANISRENDAPMMNGSSHSYDSSLADSPPPPHHSTPNSSVTSNGTHSGSYLEHSGSFHSQSRDKEGSPTPSNPVSATKPKKQALPWMAELKQKQDKKQGLVSPGAAPANPLPGGSPAVTASPNPPVTTTSSPLQQPLQTSASKDIPAKAPPLPAKPSSLAMGTGAGTGTAVGQDKTYNNLNHSSSFGSSNKPFKKSPSPAPPTTSIVTNHNSSMGVSNSDGHRGEGDGNSNKGYVSYDEYATLKSRVTSLESEVEQLKRQIKILMDRDLRGHIV